MNPFPHYQFAHSRDKNKSYYEPLTQNSFTQHQFVIPNQSSISRNSIITNQSDKYKAYYTEDKDSHNSSIFEIQSFKNSAIQTDLQTQPSKTPEPKFYATNTNSFHQFSKPPLEQIQERKKFFSISSQEKHPSFSTSNRQQQSVFLNSISTTNHPRVSSLQKSQSMVQNDRINPLNKMHQRNLVRPKSRQNINSDLFPRQSDYIDKFKKISLKRDITPLINRQTIPINKQKVPVSARVSQETSPLKTQEQATNKKRPPISPKFTEDKNKQYNFSSFFTVNQNLQQRIQAVAFNEKVFPTFKSCTQSELKTTSEAGFDENQVSLSKKALSEITVPTTAQMLERGSDSKESLKNCQKQSAEDLFKKGNKTAIVSDPFNAERPSSCEKLPGIRSNQNSSSSISKINIENFFQNSNALKTNFLAKSSSNFSIDPEVYTDMKISRIEESTSNLQQKIDLVIQKMKILVQNSKDHQISINQINQYIVKQEEEGLTSYDIKRIKKQLKIMKTNFETAFTSMTDQINRKLIKEENIMKNLSQQIKIVAEENFKLSETLSQRSHKVDSLEKSMSSFMKESQQRMENILLNQSFNSMKRSKNFSLEYGLDLKNMSNEQIISSGKNKSIDNLSKKLESIQREIKKMKVFQIEQQESHQVKFNSIQKEMLQILQRENGFLNAVDTKQMIRQMADHLITARVENLQLLLGQKESKKQEMWMSDLDIIKTKIQDLSKFCNEVLHPSQIYKREVSRESELTAEKKTGNDFELQLIELEKKERSLLISLSDYQSKLSYLEEKQQKIWTKIEEHELKLLKLTGDFRELNSSYKQTQKQVLTLAATLNNFKSTYDKFFLDLPNSLSSHQKLINALDSRIKQLDRINSVQTENIQSINTQFERVINKQIIPKFGQIHFSHVQTNQRINSIQNQISQIKENSSNLTNLQKNTSANLDALLGLKQNQQTIQRRIQNRISEKLEQYFNQNLLKFINTNVKLISTKLLSGGSPLNQIGVFKQKKQRSQDLGSLTNLLKSNTAEFQQSLDRQYTYLIDENYYLMDWQGSYLMELDQFGNRRKVKLTDDEIYFMEVNGLQIRMVQSNQ